MEKLRQQNCRGIVEVCGPESLYESDWQQFSRGVAAALLDEVNLRGKLEADIAVLELDEAWAVKFVQMVHPRFSLLLKT